MAAYDTVANIVSEVAVDVGLGSVSDVFAATDANVVQLRSLLKKVGRGLVSRHSFLQCVKEHTFTTTTASTYALPADFIAYVDGTAWNRTSDVEMLPVTPQKWQQLKATDTDVTWQCLFRSRDTTMEVWPQPPASGETIAFEYRSRYWVRATASASPDKDAPTVNTDVIHIEAELVKAALQWAFLRAKGFDSTAAEQDFRDALAAAEGVGAGAAPVLYLGRPQGVKHLDSGNAGGMGYGFDDGGLF